MKTPHNSRTAHGLAFHSEKRSDRHRQERGQTLVEFALSLTITLMMIFGLIDFSRAVYTASVVQWAAQEGARAGTVDLSQVETAARSRLVGLDLDNLVIDPPPTIVDNIITVELSYTFWFITPIISPFARNGIPMRGEASMLIR